MTEVSKPNASFRRFRLTAVRYSFAMTVVAAIGASYWSRIAVQGVLLGALAGILGFWIMAVRLEKVATTQPEKIHFFALTWSMVRFLLYGAVLLRAHFLDRNSLHGIIGAVVGIFIIRFVLMYLGITGVDRGKGSASKRNARE